MLYIAILHSSGSFWRCPSSVWPVKSCQMSIKVTQIMILLVKWKILTILQKLPKMCWWFGQNNYCARLWKVSQSIENRPIWSHCPSCSGERNIWSNGKERLLGRRSDWWKRKTWMKCDARLTQKQHNLEEREVKNKSLEYYQHTYYFLF